MKACRGFLCVVLFIMLTEYLLGALRCYIYCFGNAKDLKVIIYVKCVKKITHLFQYTGSLRSPLGEEEVSCADLGAVASEICADIRCEVTSEDAGEVTGLNSLLSAQQTSSGVSRVFAQPEPSLFAAESSYNKSKVVKSYSLWRITKQSF